MAFAWDTITQYVTEIKTASMQEVRDNADSVAVTLETSLTWSEGIVQNVDEVDHDVFQEVQDNVDFLNTSNVCSSHDAVEYVTHLVDHHTTHDGTKYATHNVTQKSSDESIHDSTHHTTHYAFDDIGNYSVYNTNVETGYHSSEQSNKCTSRRTAEDGYKHTTHYSNWYASVNTTTN